MPTFSKKQYEWLAKALLHCASNALILNHTTESRLGIAYTANFLCESLHHDNPNFNRERFLHACGLMPDKTATPESRYRTMLGRTK